MELIYEHAIKTELDKIPTQQLLNRFFLLFDSRIGPTMTTDARQKAYNIIDKTIKGTTIYDVVYMPMAEYYGLIGEFKAYEALREKDLELKPVYDGLLSFINNLTETEKLIYNVKT